MYKMWEVFFVSKQEFATLVLAMQAMYGDEFIGTEEAMDVWFALLHDLDYQILSKALQKHMLTNKFKPTVAELREIYADLICPVISDYIRTLILYGFVYDVDYSYLRQYNEMLGKISGSLNQIAKRINSTGNVYEEDMKEMKGIMDEVWRTQKAMLRKQPLIKRN